ncbi:MAG: DUF899 family protein [Alphaproteobacteria bacterium]|jgi:predicted dithiol-disulfide oxidoreductase (DUF899 family)|nr:DUF899 family protein [Alphaproteobacteria bacterium]
MQGFSLDAADAAYRAAREELRQAEIALKEQREKVAEMRRGLSAETPVPEDYVFSEADGSKVRLSELFEDGNDTLIVYHFMWAEADENPCPMCTMWHDGYNAVQQHLQQSVPVVVVAKQDAAKLRAFADSRGWSNLRTLSSGGTGFNLDFSMEDENGSQRPGLSVFVKRDGEMRHFYTVSAMMGDDHYRGMDLYSPVWNLLDLLPEGRGAWMPSLGYD